MKIVQFLIILILKIACSEIVPNFFTKIGEFSKYLVNLLNLQDLISFSLKATEKEGKKTYYMSNLQLNWVESLLVCRSFGMNLLSIKSREEFKHLNEVSLRNKYLFKDHAYMGGTNLKNQPWYWVHDNSKMTTEHEHWHTGEPNGQHEEEFCSDYIDKYDEFVINDAPCRSQTHIWNFICEKFDNDVENSSQTRKQSSKSGTPTSVVLLIIVLLIAVVALGTNIYLTRMKTQTTYRKDDEMNIID